MSEKLIRNSSITENIQMQKKANDRDGKSKQNEQKLQKIMGFYLVTQIIYSERRKANIQKTLEMEKPRFSI